MITGSKNKGDWSEFYALLYLMGERVLYSADKNLNRLPNYYFPIQKVIREEIASKKSIEKVEYVLSNKNKVEIYVGGTLIKTLTSNLFKFEAKRLFYDLNRTSGSSFVISHGEYFLNTIGLNSLGMPNSNVSDIKLELHDINTSINQIMGFSIKSYVGGAPTLLNASEATNFIFQIDDCDDVIMKDVNSIIHGNKIQQRLQKIQDNGCVLIYQKPHSDIFYDNLQMIDTKMDVIVAEIIKHSYITNKMSCKDLLEDIETKNILKYKRSGTYIYKFKQLLIAKALGMNPGKVWDGLDSANGGYIVVKDNGDVLAYHLYNRNELEQYLLDNTKLERASTSKHNYGCIYKKNDSYYINLNLQIRFI